MLELMINDCTYLAINTSTHSSECKDTKQKLHIYTCTYLIKSNDNHNVLLRNAYLEDKQLYIEKCWLSCIKSLQGLLNVNFDTECKMLGPRL